MIGWTLIWTLIAYFVYGSVELALSVALFNILLSVALLLSIVPVVGTPIYYFIATVKIIPFVYSVTQLYPTWITRWIFGLNMIGAIIMWIAVMGILAD